MHTECLRKPQLQEQKKKFWPGSGSRSDQRDKRARFWNRSRRGQEQDNNCVSIWKGTNDCLPTEILRNSCSCGPVISDSSWGGKLLQGKPCQEGGRRQKVQLEPGEHWKTLCITSTSRGLLLLPAPTSGVLLPASSGPGNRASLNS